MSRALVAVDLDRTLIFSAASAGVSVDGLRCVEHLDGRPLSYMSAATVELLAELDAQALVVPVTTRTVAQYRRVRFPGRPRRFAVAANGGEILVDGEPDRQWRRQVDATVSGALPVAAVYDRVVADADPVWLRAARVADDLFCYAVIDPVTAPDDLVERWRSWAEPDGWNVSRQGRKVYLMPDAVTKWAAVSEVAARADTAAHRILAAGDGALDRPVLERAHRSIRPRHGELEELCWHHPTLSVSRASGVAASEEIVATLLRWAGFAGSDHRSADNRDGNP